MIEILQEEETNLGQQAHYFVTQHSMTLTELGLENGASVRLCQILCTDDDEPGHPDVYRDEDFMVHVVENVRKLEEHDAYERYDHDAVALLRACAKGDVEFGDDDLKTFFEPFIGEEADRDFRDYACVVLDAYQRFARDAPRRMLGTRGLVEGVAAASVPFPKLDAAAAATKIEAAANKY